MSSPSQENQPTFADLVLQDLEGQIAADTRYAAKCRELAVVRAQYQQLLTFVRSRADVLGLVEGGPGGASPEPPQPSEELSADEAPVTNGKAYHKSEANTNA